MFHLLNTGWSKRYLPLHKSGPGSVSRTRRLIFIFSGVLLTLLFLHLWGVELGRKAYDAVKSRVMPLDHGPETADGPPNPPNWDALIEFQRNLPQHDLDLPAPEGRHGRYVYFHSQIQMLGWNNQLNEVLLNAYLAYKSNRTYVFQDYIWKTEYYPWSRSKWRSGENPPRTPVNALMSGPAVGGPWPPGDPAPRAVNEEFFDKVCPKSERRIINTGEVKPPIRWDGVYKIFNTWQKLLSEAPERCIEIQPAPREDDGFPQVFDLFLWGSDRILPIWEELRDSPVSQLFKTSPVVRAAVDRNEYLFRPRAPLTTVPYSNNPYDRMLAIHLRRGDYKEACLGLANWNSTFYSWNLLPDLPDKFINPPGYEWGHNTPENVEYYLEHCLPTEEFLINKIRTSKEDYENAAKAGEHRKLDVLFLMTNDKSQWLTDFKDLMKKQGWHVVVTTRDLKLTDEQKEVGMAVDMDIARKAAVFIGNGWSSFTSNIVHRRLVDKKEPISIRFY